MKWRVLISGKLSPAENMAIDEALFSEVISGNSLPVLRFYDWEPASVSIGYNQIAEKEVDFAALEKFGFGFVRRPTGGRMVLHQDEVTYSVIAPAKGRFRGSVTSSYSEISKALAVGLGKLDIHTDFERGVLNSEGQREHVNPCFNSVSKYELTYQGKKIVGSAQVRKEDCILQHGSILLNSDQNQIASLLPEIDDDRRKKIQNLMKKKTTAINLILSESVTFSDIVQNLLAGFKDAWKEDEFVVNGSLSDEVKRKIFQLKKEKYNSIKWNKRK